MREIIKMIFFRSMFAFGLVVAIRLLIFHIEEKMRNVQEDIDEIYEKKYKKEKTLLETRNRFLEEYGSERMRRYYELSIQYYEILSSQICGKSVEERMKDKDKVVYTKKNKSSGKK